MCLIYHICLEDQFSLHNELILHLLKIAANTNLVVSNVT